METRSSSLWQNDFNLSRRENIWEGILYASLTVNFCVLWSKIIPSTLRFLLPILLREKSRRFISTQERGLDFFGRLYTDSLFHIGLPVAGFILIATTDILSDPFFIFSRPYLIVFSVQIGRLIFVIFRDTLSSNINHNRATIIHHTVATLIYTIIIYYRQSTVSGLVGLLLEGHMLLYECGKLFKRFEGPNIVTKIHRIILILSVCGAVIFRAVIPIALICVASLRSDVLKSLFGMDYIPLASFFLSAVFYLAISCWMIFNEVLNVYYSYAKATNVSKISPLIKVVITNSFDNPSLEKGTEEGYFEKNVWDDSKNEEKGTLKSKLNNEPDVEPHFASKTALFSSISGSTECRLVKNSENHTSSCTTLLDFEDVPL